MRRARQLLPGAVRVRRGLADAVGDVRGNFTVLNDPSLRPRGCTASLGPDAAAHGADVQVYACVATNTTATF